MSFPREPRRYFIKTCARDVAWLGYLMRSLSKFDPEAEVLVVVDDDSIPPGVAAHVETSASFSLRSGRRHSAVNVEFVWPEAAAIANPYIRQQYVKLTADRMFPDGMHIQLDSDCFMLRPPTVGDFELEDGRATWFYEPWESVGPAQCWRPSTQAALGFIVPNEYMRRPGFPVHGAWLPELRDVIENLHGKSLVDYLAGLRRFSEYNVMGAQWHRTSTLLRRYYEFIRVGERPAWGPGGPCIEQGHGLKPMSPERIARYEAILAQPHQP